MHATATARNARCLRLSSDGTSPLRSEPRVATAAKRWCSVSHYFSRCRRHRVACPRGAMLRFRARPSDHHPTGINPAVMKSASLTLAGCDCRPTGTSPVETCGGIRRNKQEKQGRRNKDRHCVSTGCEMLSLHGRSMRGQFGQPYQCPVLRPVHDSLC